MKDVILYDFVFHFNPYQGLWYAVPKELIKEYFNGQIKGLPHNSSYAELIQDIKKLKNDSLPWKLNSD